MKLIYHIFCYLLTETIIYALESIIIIIFNYIYLPILYPVAYFIFQLPKYIVISPQRYFKLFKKIYFLFFRLKHISLQIIYHDFILFRARQFLLYLYYFVIAHHIYCYILATRYPYQTI